MAATLATVVAFAAGAPPAAAQTHAAFYVSPSGNDANPGTEGAPFRTIERARTAVRGLTAGMGGNIVVYLRGGTYALANTLTFDAQDSGLNGFNVIYSAYPGERPVLSGGRSITGWVDAGNGLYKASAGGLRFRQLFVNGQRAIRARTPNAGSYNEVRSWDTGGRRLEVAADEVGNWQRRGQVEMIVLGRGVNQSNLRLGSVSISGGSAIITPSEPERTRIFQQVYPPKDPYRPYFFENALEFLDAAGEWYLNTDTDEVFYRPRSGDNMDTADVVAPRLERLVSVAGTLGAPVHHLQFYGLTFAHSTWLVPSSEGYVGDQASIVYTQPLPDDEIASYPGHRLPAGVHVEAANAVRFERNVFRNMGGSALNLYVGVNDAAVVGNVVQDVSGSGISVDLNLEGNPGDARKISRRNRIANNYLTRTGRDYYQTVGIMLGYTDAAVVEHNELSDMPYSGITLGWGWDDRDSALRNNIVRYNRVQNVLNRMSDGGGIYTLSKQPGTLVAENYVHDIQRTSIHGGFNISGIYLDEGSNLITVRDNVLVNTGDRGLFQNANGSGNTLTNNGGTSSSVIGNAGLESAFDDIRSGGGGGTGGGGGGGGIACVVSAWSSWQPTNSWSACSNGQQSRTEQRTRTVVTPPSGGGAACPALTETRTVTQACSPPPPGPVACVVSSWSAWQPTSAWSACTNGTQTRSEQRTRTVVTPPSGGGTACPALAETRTASQACTPSPAPGGLTASPTAISWTVTAGSVPAAATLTVTSPGKTWQSFDTSPFYDATPACAFSSCASGARTTLTPNATFIRGAAPGTYTHAITIRAAGAPDVVVPVTLVVKRASAPTPTPGPEICGDGVDNDGDGQVDENCSPGSAPKPGEPRKLWRSVSGSTVTLGWQAPLSGGAVTGYVVDVGGVTGETQFSIPVGMTRRLEVPNVGKGRYYVRVRAVNGGGTGRHSNQVVAAVGCTAKPKAPSALAQATAGGQVAFSWIDEDGCNDTRYRVTAGSAPGLANLAVIDTPVAEMAASAPPGTYYVRVTTVSPFGESEPSNEIEVNIRSNDCAPPSFPTGLEAQLTGRDVSLNWGAADVDAALATDDVLPISWLLEVGTAAGQADIATFPMERTNSLTTAAPPGTYFVRVRPANACGVGPASNEFVIRVP